MKIKLREILCGTVFLLMFFPIDSLYGFQHPKNITEEVLFEQIETVITASKREQRIQDSPATISVITEEDIKESGALSIPDLLRYIPGIDVMQITASHWEVNARGLNQIRSNKMLTMIDGRSVNFDYYGGVIWQGLPITLDDIKKIEVIRSPISALYGANAFSGIINIITKSARESEGIFVSAEKSNLDGLRTTLIYGNRKGRLGYRISGTHRENDSWREDSVSSESREIGNIKIDYLFSGKSSMTFDAGIETGNVEQIILTSILNFDGTTYYAKANYNYSNLNLQLFWNHGDITSPSFVNYGEDANSKYDTFDGELVHTIDLHPKNKLDIGGNFRINKIESNINDKDHKQNLFAGFIQNTYSPNDKITALIGIRFDNHPLVNNNFSPRASIIYEPAKNHSFRLTASRAFRNPSFTDSYLYVPMDPIPLPSPPLPAGAQTELVIVGNENLTPEKIENLELGYQTFLKRSIKFKLDLYYNNIEDFIGTGDFIPQNFYIDPATGNPVIDPGTNMPIPQLITQSFVNLGKAEAYGGEGEIDWLVNTWVRLRCNYSYIDLRNRYTLHQYSAPPRSKWNIMSDFTFRDDLSFSLYCHYVGKSRWDIDTDNNSIPERHITPSFTTVDSRLSYKIPKTVFQGHIMIQNLFDKARKEYPIGETIGRRITFRLTARW